MGYPLYHPLHREVILLQKRGHPPHPHPHPHRGLHPLERNPNRYPYHLAVHLRFLQVQIRHLLLNFHPSFGKTNTTQG